MSAVAATLAKSFEKKRDRMSAIFVEYYPGILSACSHILQDEMAAQDTAQKTFLNAWKGLDDFRGDAKIKTWLHRIAVNNCLMEIRRRGKKIYPGQFMEVTTDEGEVLYSESLIPAQDLSSLSLVIRGEFRKELVSILDGLSPIHSKIFQAVHFQGMRHDEVARRFSISIPAVKSRLFRARQTLLKKLVKRGYGNPDDFSRSSFES